MKYNRIPVKGVVIDVHRKQQKKLLDFIEKSPTAFQAVDEMQKRLTENGFEVLSEKEYWKLVPGGKYLVTRNNSALIAFCIPEKESRVFHIMRVIAIHHLLRLRKIRK